MANAKSEADSNMIASLDWEIPCSTFKEIIEPNRLRGQMELRGSFRSKEFIWYLNLVNDGFLQLTLDCTTTTEYCFPTLYYDLIFGGTPTKPYLSRKGPVFSLSKGPRQLYSYGTLNLITIPLIAFEQDFREFLPSDNKLLISLKLHTYIEVSDADDTREIKMYLNPTNAALMNDLNQLLKEPKYSDVTIICSGGVLKAHKCILAARSTFFSETFKSVESIANEVTIMDVDVCVMKLVLQFIYTGEISLSETDLMEILRCAEKFDLSELRDLCIKKMCGGDKFLG
ncbi:protein roadkill-like [Bradysia coprophila]|uniref:protein roadkill-like n=1 Tax=Bradysia coprophila TaxID=38358 RepID=UPI00187DD514|nr:protein roadkill-like [Bradysia coprophila]